MAASTSDHIERFLAPIDPQGTFVRLMEAMVRRAQADPAAGRAVKAIREWLAKPLVSPEVEARLQSCDVLGRDGPDRLQIGSTTVRLGLALGYLRAQEGLRALAATGQPPIQTILDRLPRAAKGLGSLEPDFISELLLETQRRAAEDPAFAERLRVALREVQAVHPHASAWASVLFASPGAVALTAHCNLSGGPFECGVVIVFVVLVVVVLVATK